VNIKIIKIRSFWYMTPCRLVRGLPTFKVKLFVKFVVTCKWTQQWKPKMFVPVHEIQTLQMTITDSIIVFYPENWVSIHLSKCS